MVTSKDSVATFAETCKECCDYFTDPNQWSEIWMEAVPPMEPIFSELKKYYTEEQIVALGWKTGLWFGYGRLVHALDVPSVGESCVIPLKRASG
jgi:hypothetical protein